MTDPAQQLYDDGVAVINILDGQEEVDRWRELIEAQILAGPEVKQGRDLVVADLQGGSFKALGTPTSFHCAAVRDLRKEILTKLAPFVERFSELCGQPMVEMLFDRWRHQLKGATIGGFKVHRDESTEAEELDAIFGGWINMSPAGLVQCFNYLEGTQLRDNKKRGHSGAKPTAEQLKKARVAEVQPGQLIFFYQNILHRVARVNKLPGDSVRLHYGLRFTSSDKPLFPLDAAFDNFDPPLIPSGQQPYTSPQLYNVNHIDKLYALTENFVEEVREKRKRKGVDVVTLPRVLRPTPEMREHYRAYEPEERALYQPHPAKRARDEEPEEPEEPALYQPHPAKRARADEQE
jgi:hypothetical protein